MRYPRLARVVLALCGAGLVGCATPTPVGAPPAGPTMPALPTGGTPTTLQAEVTGVRRGPTPQTALVDVSVPAGNEGCAGPPRVELLAEENGSVYANVVVDSSRALTVGGCPNKAPAVATLTAPDTIGERPLVLNQQAWAPAGTGYRRCDADLGCTPPADHCAPAWIDKVVNGLDVPRHSYRNTEHCDQSWLVLTVDVNSSACGAAPRPGCSAPPNVTRYVLRFESAWVVTVRTTAAGCTAILAAVPDFPHQFCEKLPATR